MVFGSKHRRGRRSMEIRKTNYVAKQVSGNGEAPKSNLKKITGLFKTEQGTGFEVKVNDEILAALSGLKVGDFLKVYQNEAKGSGKQYLSLSVKPVAKKA